MSKFYVTSKDKNGKTKSQTVDALDVNSAVAQMQAQGLFVVNVQPLDDVKVSVQAMQVSVASQRKYGHKGVKMEDMLIFARQLATMLDAGVPLLRSLSVIAEQVDSEKLGLALQQIKGDVEAGDTFSHALSKHNKIFSQFWVSLIEVGEASGNLPQVLNKLTQYVEDDAKFRGQIVGAMVYPGVMMVVCICAILFFALFVAPTFEGVFKDLDTDLPGITIALLAVFAFIKTQWWLIALGIAGMIFAFKSYIKTTAGRYQWEAIIFNMPVIGMTARYITIERFSSQMAVLIATGVPILFALEISERLVENLTCADVIKEVREAVREGKLLAQPMEDSGFFPPMVTQMIKVGEETGELGKMLNHVAVYYKQNIEEFIKRIGTLIEPVMIIFMGGIIGTIVIAMFLPLMSLTG